MAGLHVPPSPPLLLLLLLLLLAIGLPETAGAGAGDALTQRSDISQLVPELDLWATLLRTRRQWARQRPPADTFRRVPGPATLELQLDGDAVPGGTGRHQRSDSSSLSGPHRRGEAVARAIGRYITPIAYTNASNECREDSRAYLTSILTELWALKMFDATGKLPDGLFFGRSNANPWGNWDECLNTTAHYSMTNGSSQTSTRNFSGKYCMAFLKKGSWDSATPSPVSPRAVGLAPIMPVLPTGTESSIGMCIPSSCTADELGRALNIALPFVSASVPDYMCYTKDDETVLSAGAVFMITILVIVGACMLVGTIIDIVAVKDAGNKESSGFAKLNASIQALPITFRKVFLTFSVFTNGRKLLDTSSSADTLGCLHGIRFLSNTWVILGHTYYFLVFYKHQNPAHIVSWFDSVAIQAIFNATVSVDSFFFLSGLLVSYIALRNIERAKGKLNILMFYVHRYVRLTPVMMMVIGFVATLEVYLGSGPWWGTVDLGGPQVCRNSWWKNMLYINNLVDMDEQCIGQTWYLANDMQMFIFSPLVLLPLYHRPVLGQLWLIFLVCFFTGINAMITVIHKLGPSGALPDGDDANLRYMKPWTRAGPYLVGLYMGWVLHKIRGREIRMPVPVVAIGWLTASLTGCLIVYGLYDAPSVPPETTSVIYGMLNRTAWSVCLAWVVFACVTGYGGFVNTLLSWKAFIPLSRLTYTSYLVSIDVQLYYWNSLKAPVHLDHTFVVYQFLGSLPVIFAVSLVFSLAFESPMIGLEKLVFPQPSRPAAAAPKPAVAEQPGHDTIQREPSQQDHVNKAFEGDGCRAPSAQVLSPALQSVHPTKAE